MAGGSFRRRWRNWTTSVAHLGLLGIAAYSESALVGGLCLLSISAISLLAWRGNYRRWRFILDTPTSRIDSAAQGYAELAGAAVQGPGAPLLSELTRTPCCWYWFRIEKRGDKNRWTFEREGESSSPFLLDDKTGGCVLYPHEAEVHSSRSDTWQSENRRYTETLILPGDPLYAIGEFSTLRPARQSVAAATAALLVSWKHDPCALHERFDLDLNGEIDLEEWALARRQARREAERALAATAAPPAVHTMRRPADGRMFMLTNLDPARFASRYQRWKWIHLVIFFAGLGFGTLLLT